MTSEEELTHGLGEIRQRKDHQERLRFALEQFLFLHFQPFDYLPLAVSPLPFRWYHNPPRKRRNRKRDAIEWLFMK